LEDILMKRSVIASMVALGFAASAAYASSMFIDTNGNVGIGTETADQKLHVFDGNMKVSQSAENAILEFAAGANLWRITQNVNTGRLVFFYPGGGAVTGSFKFDPSGQENLLRVGVLGSDIVDITGRLFVNGVQQIPDYVFEDEYALKSIEEQSKFMFENKHLPSVPKAGENYQGSIDITQYQMGMLEELEKAHIYISQLNETVKELKAELAELKSAE
jgi:hypothetical protein